ncbi:hypothetical protein H072_7354 [Dactylellina haptotyla CBS 200.50]|uniref:Protein phosphatase n=1 Tax=Dactylellina haptotyla (strain CBS 200.50) TaxID=1284197 RepID=S8BUA8_DACHA|nr:hypothetical protein H072_7354 [Dactylellina haptotyla CBS 200.50]
MLAKCSRWSASASISSPSFWRVGANATFSTHSPCRQRAFTGTRTKHVFADTSSNSPAPQEPLSSFQTGFSLYAKRPPRPFPKPWINPPTSSFSEPLSVHSTSLSRRPLHPHQHQLYTPENASLDPTLTSGGAARFLRGYTNGDDALLMHSRYLAVADGVGSWNMRDKGYPALWSRLLVHYFSIGCERFFNRGRRRKKSDSPPSSSSSIGNNTKDESVVDVQGILNEAFNAVIKATGVMSPSAVDAARAKGVNPIGLPTSNTQRYHGTTTFTGCVLHKDILHVVNVGDSHCLVLRPSTLPTPDTKNTDEEHTDPGFLFRTKEGWHYFDCPRQLGTDSPDTPLENATVSSVRVRNGDIVILATDGMLDNLWEEEVISIILKTLAVSAGGDDQAWEMELGQMMRKKGKKRVEEGVNVAFREILAKTDNADLGDGDDGGELMTKIAAELVKAAKVVATDPYAESPWMERALEEGIGAEGGKLDDISVVIGRVVGV